MRLLRDKDYLSQIQSDNLEQITESVDAYRLEKEQAGQAEMISYLTQRYLADEIFTDTTSFSISATYFGKNLVEYTETAYDSTATYLTNDRVVFEDNIYFSIAGNTAEPFNITKWTFITEDKSLYFAKLNAPEYNNKTEYVVSDIVWYQDKVYTATTTTTGNIPTNTSFWTVGATYSFSGSYPDDTLKWTKGDNRNALIVMYLIDITLFHLYSRINPRNIPDLRKERYNGNDPMDRGGAIGWLKKVASGDITADLPRILPSQGVSILGGSIAKRVNLPTNW